MAGTDLFNTWFLLGSFLSVCATRFGLGAFALGVLGVLGVAVLLGVDLGFEGLFFGMALVSSLMFDFFLLGLFIFSSSLI